LRADAYNGSRRRAAGHQQTRSRGNFVICSTQLNVVWPEMTGRNMQRVAKYEPDVLCARFRPNGREQLVTAACRGGRVFLNLAVRLPRRGRNGRMLDGRPPLPLRRPSQTRTRGTTLLRAAGGLGGDAPGQSSSKSLAKRPLPVNEAAIASEYCHANPEGLIMGRAPWGSLRCQSDLTSQRS